MKPRNKLIVWLIVLGLVDVVVPVPVLAATGIYIAATRPPWFRRLVSDLYADAPPPDATTP